MAGILRTEIELRDPKQLQPYEHNNKRHGPDQIKKLARAIAEHGFDQPIVVDRHGVIIKGHARHETALSMGLKQVPVIVAADLTPEQVRAARIADNVIADDGELILAEIQHELEALNDLGYDLGLTGFDDDELSKLLDGLPATDYQPPEQQGWQPPTRGDRPENAAGRDPNRGEAGGGEERFPLAIVLTWAEMQDWRAAKESAGISNDKAMLLNLLEN